MGFLKILFCFELFMLQKCARFILEVLLKKVKEKLIDFCQISRLKKLICVTPKNMIFC